MLYRDDFDSSNIKSIAYEKNARSLYVTFKSAAVYLYEGVTPEVVSALLAAPSKGKPFGANIRRKRHLVDCGVVDRKTGREISGVAVLRRAGSFCKLVADAGATQAV